MAIANSDGSIILSTKVDTSGLNKGMSQMQGKATSLTKTFSKLGAAISSAFAIQKIIQFSNESASLATQTEASVQRLVDIYGSASRVVGDFIDQNARALGMSKSAAASFSSVYGNLFSVWADQETNAQLTNQYLQTTAVVASKTGRTVEDVQERIRSGLLGNTEAIEDLGIFVNVKTIEMTDAFKRMANGKSWEQLDAYTQQQIRSMAILEQATAKYGDQVEETSATIRNQYKAAYEDFQNSWGNIVNTVLLPVLKVVTQIFDIMTQGLNAISGISGNILGDTQIPVENTENTAENISEQVENQKELNKQLGLAGFDEIQKLSSSTAENTKEPNIPVTPNIGDLNDFDGAKAEKQTSKTLKRIMKIIGGALVGIGILLIISKKIGWGIGFIIAGASLFGVTAAASISEASDLGVGAVIASIMGIIGDALLAVGIILLFKGQIPWGISFIVEGAALMAIEYISTTEFSEDPIQNTLTKIELIAGTAMLALGIILAVFSGISPLSLGLIAGGAILIVESIVLNSDAIVEAIEGPLGVIMAIVGEFSLAIGIILVCSGVALPLGIALIAEGAVSLVTPITLGWDAIVGWVKGAWESIKSFWNKYIAVVFTGKFWSDLAKTCGNGLIIGFESAVNGIIWLFEKMINFVVSGLNLFLKGVDAVISAVGNVFGQDWGVASIKEVELGRVSIPRLAQGAVIPPNREFLAVLGDQKQGTNIEAPLSTIQDAVSSVMSGQNEAIQGILEQILEAILGIQIGDDVIGRASQRYNRTMTKIYGG